MFGYDHGGWMFGGSLVMLLAWLVPIALVIWLASSWSRRSGQNSSGKNALDMLKERYARGEIGQGEFDKMKREITS